VSAQKLSEVVLQISNDQLSPLAGSSNNTANKAAIAMIDKDLIELKDLLKNRASAQDVMMLVHGRLHPSLQFVYDLKLKQ
jgi:predicted methyltransferase